MKSSLRQAGFTLIELMIVIAIMAAAVALVIPKIANRSNQIKTVLRQLSVLSHQLHQKAKLTGTTYRIVIDMKDGASGKQTQTFWVEHSKSSTLVKPGEELLKPEKDKNGKDIIKSDFSPDTTIFKRPQMLPTGMRFENVELSRMKDPITTGKAFIHYLPQGLVEESAIHLKPEDIGNSRRWTIAIHPLTGKAEIITESRSLQDIRKQ